MNEAITIIKEYIAFLDEPDRNWPRKDFVKRSYSRWAAEELLTYVQSCPDDWTAIHAVESFKDMMGDFGVMAANNRYADLFVNDVQYIFDIACSVAEDISEILMGALM